MNKKISFIDNNIILINVTIVKRVSRSYINSETFGDFKNEVPITTSNAFCALVEHNLQQTCFCM